MLWYQYLLGSILIVISIVLIIIVLMQEGKSAGLSGAIAGGAETFFGKNKGRTYEAKLAKFTKFVAIAFFVLALGTMLLFTFI
ncbi:MAG: preprotein translocase subunit SecG [Clostridia bacterium]|nr:preprotein translocase subunit SecG [Clostridia bacterium]